ncbi:MAG: hypothetical protein DRO11_00785 [Methanobacteriota archaeon]|nr:MAG: hypothetical protein DRO11_00785 [Euryarchaeota archaeon]
MDPHNIERIHTFLACYPHPTRSYLDTVRRTKILELDPMHIIDYDKDLFDFLISNPRSFFREFQEALSGLHNFNKPPEILIDVSNVPKNLKTEIRDISEKHLGKIVFLDCLVGPVKQRMFIITKACYRCLRCGEETEVVVDQLGPYAKIKPPMVCRNPSCNRRGPFVMVNDKRVETSYQEFWLQEEVGVLNAGEIPYERRAFVIGEHLINRVTIGEHVTVAAVVEEMQPDRKASSERAVRGFALNVVGLRTRRDDELIEITEADIEKAKKLAQKPNVIDILADSFCPEIIGMKDLKIAILLSIVGGLQGRPIRSNIHTLCVSPPGLGKSTLGRYAQECVQRGVYTSGELTSGPGLTAVVTREPSTGEWQIRPGAMVWAHSDGKLTNLVVIDEIEKLKDDERSKIHDAMESGLVNLSKAGIMRALPANTPIVGFANIKNGEWEENQPRILQTGLSPTLLDRFSLVLTLDRDRDPERAEKFGEHIARLWSNQGSKPQGILSKQELKKYLLIAKATNPEMDPSLEENIKKIAVSMLADENVIKATGLKLTERQVIDIPRIAGGIAKLTLSEKVTLKHLEMAVDLWRRTTLEAYKDPNTSEAVFGVEGLQPLGVPEKCQIFYGENDTEKSQAHKNSERKKTGKLSLQEKVFLAKKIITELCGRSESGEAKHLDVRRALQQHGLSEEDAITLINLLHTKGMIMSPRFGSLVWIGD